MTIICAITDGAETIIGSDSAMFYGHTYSDLRKTKWHHWPASGWWVGISSALRATVVLDAAMSGERNWDAEGIAQRMRGLLGDDGWKFKEPEGDAKEVVLGVLIAKPGELWRISRDFCPRRAEPGEFLAVGAGWELATGAADALAAMGRPPRQVVKFAIEVTIGRSVWCGGSAYVDVLRRKS